MDNIFRKLIKLWTFQLAHTNLKMLRKVSKILHCCTTDGDIEELCSELVWYVSENIK